MNNTEAQQLLDAHLSGYRRRSYRELVAILEQPEDAEIQGPSGATYYVQVQVFWDSKPDGDVRVAGSINDGGWRAFVPLIEDFILAPSGTFVGE